MNYDTRETLGTIRRIVAAHAEEGESAETAFTGFMLEKLEERGAIENGSLLFTKKDSPPIKINGYGVSEDGHVVYLVVAAFFGDPSPSGLRLSDLRHAVECGKNYMDFLFADKADTLQVGSDERDGAEFLRFAMDECRQVRLVVVTDREVETNTIRPDKLRHGKQMALDLWGLNQLARALADAEAPAEIEVDLRRMGSPLPCLQMPRVDTELDVYTAIFQGAVLASLYDIYSQRILETNVRAFLKATGATNRGIKETLKTTPQRFMAYNNGIVMTATGLELSETGGSRCIDKLMGIQIVNGGQTTASLYNAMTEGKVDLSAAFVHVKIVVMTPEHSNEHTKKISICANTQNAVKQPDFASNDAFQRDIQVLARRVSPPDQQKWYYERATGQYGVDGRMAEQRGTAALRVFEATFPKGRKFTKTDLSSWVSLWDGLPHDVSKGGQSNFDVWRNRQKQAVSEPSEDDFRTIVAKGIVCRAVAKVVKAEKFPAYAILVTNYTTSLIAEKLKDRLKLDRIWSRQAMSDEFLTATAALVHRVDREIRSFAGQANVTQVGKKPALWSHIRMMDLGWDLSTLPETR